MTTFSAILVISSAIQNCIGNKQTTITGLSIITAITVKLRYNGLG